MQAKARRVRAAGMRRLLQPEQDTPQPRRQAGGQAGAVVPFVQRPQPLVPDLHRAIVTCRASRRNPTACRKQRTLYCQRRRSAPTERNIPDMQYGRFGFWYPTDRLDGAGLGDLVRAAEGLGCSHFWYPESTGYESFALASFLLAQSLADRRRQLHRQYLRPRSRHGAQRAAHAGGPLRRALRARARRQPPAAGRGPARPPLCRPRGDHAALPGGRCCRRAAARRPGPGPW